MNDYKYWPKHSGKYESGRHFREVKRLQIRELLRAAEEFRLGCSYTPAYREFSEAVRNLTLAKELLSVKRWKR